MLTDLAVQGLLTEKFTQVVSWVLLALLLFKIFALVDAAIRREDAYRATGKQSKPFWLIILAVAIALDVFVPSLIFSLIGLVAAIVYVVDVRPAIRAISPPRRKRDRDRTGTGPTPWS